MSKRKFWSDVIFVQVINILIKTVWILVIDRAVQNILPPSHYGSYYRLLSMSILFVIVLDLGLNNMNSKEVAQDASFFRSNFRSFLSAKLALAGVYATILFSSALFLNLTDDQLFLLAGLAAFQIINSFNQYLRSNIAALHLFKLDGLLAVADRLLVIIVIGAWLIVPQYNQLLTVKSFVFVQLGGVALTLLIALGINITKLKLIPQTTNKSNVIALVKGSLPYALLITLMAIFTRIDAVMIGEILDDTETDRYAMCYRLIDAANMMAALFSGMLLPMFARLISSEKPVTELIGTATRLLIIPAVIVAAILTPHASELLELMYPNRQGIIAPDTFVLLTISFISSASVFVFGTLLTAGARLKALNQLAILAAVANIVLNFWLIPSIGIKGAALATLITQSIFALGCVAYSYKAFSFTLSSKLGLRILIVLALFATIFYGSIQFFENSFVHIAFGIALSILLVVGGGIINLNVLKILSRRKT
jgi:O-antigen/teichoic acid export membrane protein